MRLTAPLFLLFIGMTIFAQDNVQLTPIPPRPTCTLIFKTGACADLWNAYNRAVAQRQQEELQLYVKRQKDLAAQAATAPLQEQLDGLNKLVADQQGQIKKLQQQMQSDATTALETKQSAAVVAHREGLQQGLLAGGGGMLLLFIVIFGIWKVTRTFTISKKTDARSASA